MDMNWKKIWSSKKTILSEIDSEDEKSIFMELKRLTGNDTTGNGVSYEVLMDRIERFMSEMTFSEEKEKRKSIFEVGCGSGANLYVFIKQGYQVGGLDYSGALIEVAKQIVNKPLELYCEEAKEMDTAIKYDIVFSNSAFEYFPDEQYAIDVCQKMIEKSNKCIGILEVHDPILKTEFIDFRRKTIQNYDERYKNLDKLFISKELFLNIAEKNELDIKFVKPRIQGYWNTDYIYDVYMYKRK